MNLKPKCTQCKKELSEKFRMVLMIGPQGYRRYACCDKCAAKAEMKQKAESKMQSRGDASLKAGA